MTQRRVRWLPEAKVFADDAKDWDRRLSAGEQNPVTRIFRLFTQSAGLLGRQRARAAFTERLHLLASRATLPKLLRFNRIEGMG